MCVLQVGDVCGVDVEVVGFISYQCGIGGQFYVVVVGWEGQWYGVGGVVVQGEGVIGQVYCFVEYYFQVGGSGEGVVVLCWGGGGD